ncbi:MAG: MATE family efflux transporter [Gammaproteobacteria bacterium]|nr:MATE family efflux transporter [Gammaproteobacteria bacterium]
MLNDKASVLKEISKNAIPIIISLSIGVFSVLIVTKILGKINVTNFYILALFLPINFFILSLNEAIRAAIVVLSSPLTPEKDSESIANNIVALLFVTIFVFIFSMLILVICKKFLVSILHVGAEHADAFYYFSLFMMAANILIGFSSILLSTLRALKRPTSGMVLSLFSAAVTILLTFIFGNYYAFGLNSFVLAIIVTHTFVIVLGIFILKFYGVIIRISSGSISYCLKKLKQINSIGMPVFLSYLMIFSSLFVNNIFLSHFNKDILSGYGIACRLQSIIILPAIGIGYAMAILINTHLAKKDYMRATKIFRVGINYTIVLYLLAAVSMFLFSRELSLLITNDEAILLASSIYLRFVSLSYIGMGASIVLFTIFEQTGLGIKSLIANIFYCLLLPIIGGFIALYTHQYVCIYLTLTITNFLALIYVAIVYLYPSFIVPAQKPLPSS